MLSKNIKIDKTICVRLLLSVILDSCDLWCLTLRCKHRVGAFRNQVPRRMFVPGRVREDGTKKLEKIAFLKSFMICTAYHILLG